MASSERENLFKQVLADSTGIILKIVRAFAPASEDRDDLFQEIVLQIWNCLPTFQGNSKATTWVYRVALNTALNWQRDERKRRKQSDFTFGTEESLDQRAPEQRDTESREMVEWLQRQLQSLGPVDRALMLMYLEGESYRAIAEVLGMSESNVGVKLSRIRQRLTDSARRAFDGL
jgi:RNA polymerase sigma-70 factor (ECF subfamily)